MTPLHGAFTNLPSQNTAGFLAYQQQFPAARVSRWFHSRLPASINTTEAAGCYQAGIVPFLSVKPSKTAPGSDAATSAKLAGTMPSGYLAAWHEPENDMPAATYVAIQQKFYEAVKPVSPQLIIVDVAMAYQYDPGHNVPDVNAWQVPDDHCDARGCDIYSEKFRSKDGVTPLPIDQLPGFQRWHAWAASLGKPLIAAELGCSVAFSDQARADWYAHAYEWLTAEGYALILPWNGNATPGKDQFYYWGGPTPFPLTAAAVAAAGNASEVVRLRQQVADLEQQVQTLSQARPLVQELSTLIG